MSRIIVMLLLAAGLLSGGCRPKTSSPVVGRGGAEKQQVQHMVGLMLGLQGKLQADAADALAVAITHAHVRATANRLGVDARMAWSR